MNTNTDQTILTPFERKTIAHEREHILAQLQKSKATIKNWPLPIVLQQQPQLNVLQVLIDHFSKPPTTHTKEQQHAWD